MELDDMKQLWQKMDDTLQQQKLLNNKMIKQMIIERNSNSIKTLSNVEYTGFFVSILLVLLLLTRATQMGAHAGILVCYIFTLSIGIVSVFLGWYKIRLLTELKAVDRPITQLAEKTQKFRLIISKERVAFIILGPVLIATFYIIATYIIRDTNILTEPIPYIKYTVLGSIFYFILLIAVYKLFYFDNIDKINKNLEEIKDFKEEY